MDPEQALFRLFGMSCSEGTVLYTEGSPGEGVYFIDSGTVRLDGGKDRGAPAVTLGPGDFFGEEAFFTTAPRPSSATVVQDARLVLLRNDRLEAVVRHGPRMARLLTERFLDLAAGAKEDLAAWTVADVLRRLRPRLVAAARTGVRAVDLAEQSGVPETDVLLVLDELARRRCLRRVGREYRATDGTALQAAVDEIEARLQPGDGNAVQPAEEGR